VKGIFVRAVVALSPVLWSAGAAAQVPTVVVSGSAVLIEEVVEMGEGEEVPPEVLEAMLRAGVVAPTAVAKPQDGKDKPSPRAQKFQQLEFDRRPSTILKTWGEPPKKPAAAAKPEIASRTAGASGLAEALRGAVEEKAADVVAELPASAPASRAESRAASAPTSRAASGPTSRATSAPTSRAADTRPSAAEEAKAIDAEIEAWKRNVTLGRWTEVAAYLKGLPNADAKAGYERMLQTLADGPRPTQPVQPAAQQFVERNRFTAADVVGLVAAAPCDLEKPATANLGRILRACLDAGGQLDTVLAALRPLVDAEGSRLDRRRAARVLFGANEFVAAGEFLATPEEAETKNDREGLNLLSRHFLAKNSDDAKVEWLERAWKTTQTALAAGDVPEEEKADALRRAVELAPRVKAELGAAWLDESFTTRPERGMEVLAAIGASSAGALVASPTDVATRKKWLELQTTAAKALQRAAPERAKEWGPILAVLAGNWLREALVTYQYDEDASLNPRMQRDMYGNFYYGGYYGGNFRNPNQPQAVKTAEVLDLRPQDDWLAFVDDAQRPKFHFTIAQLLLKAGEPEQAFPFIEAMARTHPKPAKDLVDEFLTVWAKNHDPNSSQRRTNPYIFVYGFEERASGIPLTRSKQERNLKELGGWIAKLRALPVELDEDLLTRCFTTAHGTAEIYRLETLETVFGPIKDLKPSVLGSLAQGMRQNLATVWRDARTQENAKTKRKKQDIEAEVTRGYELARLVISRALAAHPESWELRLADAAFLHDENSYRSSLKKDSGHSARNAEAFAGFKAAADLYRKALDAGMDREDETLQPYETWFYAALGACDLGALTHEHAPSLDQVAAVKTALAELGGERGKRHEDMFASALFSRIGSAKPAVKFRYLREGLSVAGDNKLCREAVALFDYYKDLVTEVRLVTEIDGPSDVGHGGAFGLRVDLRHTREIERESGGFAKYLQNQNSMSYSYNYGRPTEDYRDKFDEAARAALAERFEVLSVTFNHPEVKSVPAEEMGWRVTPYAYLLLKPKGPEVDRIPALRLDLDFLDTSGYAVLPVESAVLPIDARAPAGPPRPYSNLKLVATADERTAKDGKLLYELKATARGVVPELSAIVDPVFDGFEIKKRDDGPVSVVKFDEEGDGKQVLCERLFTFTLAPKAEAGATSGVFRFPKPKLKDAVVERYRYEDADLVSAPESFELGKKLHRSSRAWMWWTFGGLAAALVATFVVARKRRLVPTDLGPQFGPPEHATPFTVLGFLRALEKRPEGARLAPELRAEIARIEAHYFGGEGSAPDLVAAARGFASKAGLN
jgi:hypothetical protein